MLTGGRSIGGMPYMRLSFLTIRWKVSLKLRAVRGIILKGLEKLVIQEPTLASTSRLSSLSRRGILQHLSPEDLPDALSEVALVTEKYLLLSYTQAEETKITFDGKFFQNYYSEEYMRGLVPEDFEVETYRNVGRFATVLLKRKK